MPLIRTEAVIPARPEAVWAVLADFSRYHEWNPLNLRAAGKAEAGAKVRMTFLNPARPGTTIDQTVTVTEAEPGRRLAWLGKVPILFRGFHHFTLTPTPDGTRLEHGEDLSGLITRGFTEARLRRDFYPAYEACNAALARRLEGLPRTS